MFSRTNLYITLSTIPDGSLNHQDKSLKAVKRRVAVRCYNCNCVQLQKSAKSVKEGCLCDMAVVEWIILLLLKTEVKCGLQCVWR